MALEIYPFIAPDVGNTLVWGCAISKEPEDVAAIKHLTRSHRYRVEFTDPGHLYISDNARQVNGYFMLHDWLIKYENGDLMAIKPINLHNGMKPAGIFCNYEQDHDNG